MGDKVLETIRDIIWSFPLVLFLMGFGVVLLVCLRKYPILDFRWIWKVTFGKLNKHSLSVFSLALGGTMGVGNIIGASSCVLLFGAGSLFWMWVSAIVGMVIKYAEIVIAMHYRKRVNNEFIGGPMVNMENGLSLRWMAVLYACLCIVTSLGIGNLVPMNALVSMVSYHVDVSIWWIVGFSLFMAFILFKGKVLIEKVCLYMVPLMSILFIGACLGIVLINIDGLYAVFGSVFSDVFDYKAMFGGAFWMQLQMGMARGIYSNEAGMGTSSIVHVKGNGVGCEQGAWGILEVCMDTVISCTLSALVVLLMKDFVEFTDVYQAVYVCFINSFGMFGNVLYMVSMLFFATSGMLAWCYYARECLGYLRVSIRWYSLVFVLVLFFGSLVDTSSLWMLTDIGNGLMVLLNVSSMFGLCDIVMKSSDKYFNSFGNHVK